MDPAAAKCALDNRQTGGLESPRAGSRGGTGPRGRAFGHGEGVAAIRRNLPAVWRIAPMFPSLRRRRHATVARPVLRAASAVVAAVSLLLFGYALFPWTRRIDWEPARAFEHGWPFIYLVRLENEAAWRL